MGLTVITAKLKQFLKGRVANSKRTVYSINIRHEYYPRFSDGSVLWWVDARGNGDRIYLAPHSDYAEAAADAERMMRELGLVVSEKL